MFNNISKNVKQKKPFDVTVSTLKIIFHQKNY